MLIITNFQSEPEAIKNRKGIVISSRVHPGETGASYKMKGVIDYLTGPTLNAKILRDNFVFKIVPFLNPDGVINGSSRCSLAGVDLTQWTRARGYEPRCQGFESLLAQFLQYMILKI